jgi:hypothetical protein
VQLLTFSTKKHFCPRLTCPLFFVVVAAGIWITPLFAQEDSATSACSLEGPQNCQLFDGSLGRTPSDREIGGYGILAAEDFVPQSDTLHSLCVWGQYVDTDPQAAGVDCASLAAADSFRVRIYTNGDDLPYDVFAESNATSTRTPAFLNRDTIDPAPIYKFELVLDLPISGLITDGRAYWLEVSNSSSTSGSPYCFWHWSQLSANSVAGNNYSAKGNDWGYGPVDGRAVDHAFCVNMDIAPGGMGPVVHPCCRCDGSCELSTLSGCDQMGGSWNVTHDTCASVSCPSGPPANDTCSMKQVLSAGSYVFDTNCAGTELVSPVETELGPALVGKDIWFSYRIPSYCYLDFATCWSRFDTVIAVYFDPDNPDVCPCPTDENLETFLAASDEGCTGASVGGGGSIQIATECESVPLDICYTIRIGGFNGDSGIVNLDVSCVQVGLPSPAPPQADPSGISKSRFFSLLFPLFDDCGYPWHFSAALRVKLTSLHHVNPPYTGGPSIPFTSFEGQIRWIGPPVEYIESTSNPMPFMASNLQCTPHYRDWNTLELLHVTGSAIVPSSTYSIETIPIWCQGQESTCMADSPLFVSTTRWGDVETPYNPPSPTAQPDLADVSALVNKFRSAPGAPIKARALLVGSDAFGNFTPAGLNVDLSFAHIATCVDAFKGKPYPHTIAACP